MSDLDLKSIAAQIGMDYNRLYRYVQQPVIAEHLGRHGKDRVFPEESLPRFHALARLDADRTVTPKTVVASINRGVDLAAIETEPAVSISENAIAKRETQTLIPVVSGDQVEETLRAIAVMPQEMRAVAEAILSLAVSFSDSQSQNEKQKPPAEDCLIGREEAARLLCCSPRACGRYVRQVRRGVWRRSDVLRYIAGL